MGVTLVNFILCLPVNPVKITMIKMKITMCYGNIDQPIIQYS